MAKTSQAGQIRHLIKDKGYDQKRAIAAALAIAREKGYKVPKGKTHNPIPIDLVEEYKRRQMKPITKELGE